MNTTKALWDLNESRLVSYPRYDNEPVVGLDNQYVIVDLVHGIEPLYNPIEEQLVQTTSIDLDALTYTYDWIVEPLPPPQPNYHNFYSALMVSSCYKAILTEVLSNNSPAPYGSLVLFISTMHDCLNGNANPSTVQNSIWLLLGQLNLDTVYLEELQTMLGNAHLDQLYSLTPPEL
jgi:hypothetical protein